MFLRTVAANGNRRKSLANTENGSGRRGSAAAEMERRKSSLNNMVNTSRYDRRQSAIEGRYLLNRTDTQLFNIPESLSPSLISIQRRSLSVESSQTKDQVYDIPDWPPSRTSSLSRPTSFQPFGRVTFRLRGQQFFETFESTLERFPDTLLGDKLKREQYFDQKLNCYIINRCQHSFSAVLFYYQSDGILSRPLDIDRENFIKELEFYQIEECIDARHRQEQKMVEDNNRSKLSPQGRAREFIWKILEYQERTMLAKFCFYFYLMTSILAIVIFCAETEPQFKSKTFWDPLETAVNVLFTIEYILRLYSAPSIKGFIFSAFGVVDLFAIVPFYCNVFIRLAGNKAVTSLSILTLLRVLRVFKLTRCNEGLRILMMTIYESLHHLRSIKSYKAVRFTFCLRARFYYKT